MKNVMGAHEPFSLYFIVVSSVASFFINLVLNYIEESDMHFIGTHSPF